MQVAELRWLISWFGTPSGIPHPLAIAESDEGRSLAIISSCTFNKSV
jgi:hypothetical protein